ncbi:MAG: NUDIX domain-containing protein [Pseudomonadota bacterium]|nr:NUDIX domain-containing protein [Pseudomonadota bacterium]
MNGPANLRAYGLLARDSKILISEEKVAGKDILKFPGGGVEPNETPEQALRREFMEECSLSIEVLRLLHIPGTLFSPWTHTHYTPMYYQVDGIGRPTPPTREALTLSFFNPITATSSGRMADPEIEAIRRLFGDNPTT